MLRDIGCNQVKHISFICTLVSDWSHHAFHRSTPYHMVARLKACETVTIGGGLRAQHLTFYWIICCLSFSFPFACHFHTVQGLMFLHLVIFTLSRVWCSFFLSFSHCPGSDVPSSCHFHTVQGLMFLHFVIFTLSRVWCSFILSFSHCPGSDVLSSCHFHTVQGLMFLCLVMERGFFVLFVDVVRWHWLIICLITCSSLFVFIIPFFSLC